MAQTPEEFPAITVTITKRLRDWLYERRRLHGIPVSRTVRDALDLLFAQSSDDDQDKRESA